MPDRPNLPWRGAPDGRWHGGVGGGGDMRYGGGGGGGGGGESPPRIKSIMSPIVHSSDSDEPESESDDVLPGSPPTAVASKNIDESISQRNVEAQPQEPEQCAKDHMHQKNQTAANVKTFIDEELFTLVFMLVLIASFVVFGFHTLYPCFIMAIVFLLSLMLSLMDKFKLLLKCKIWQLLGIIFKSNNSKLLKFADFVRKASPHVAPCNALHGEVSCVTTTSKYVARTYCAEMSGLPGSCLHPIVALDIYSKETFSSQVFHIGAGIVHVIRLSEDQFRFKSEVREKVLEDFVAITDWESIATILCILEFWENSPKVGVIENLIEYGKAIYCHALSIKEIVEGVGQSLDHFSIFQLQEEKEFYVGCGSGCVSISGDKTSGGNDRHIVTTLFLAVTVAVGSFFQLRDNYPKVAIPSIVILIGFGTLISFMDVFGCLFKQSCFYWFCTMLCLGSENSRLGIYLWLKKGDSILAYCDDFRPDQLQAVDSETEVIYLYKSLYKSRDVLAVQQKPDWATFPSINIQNLGTLGVWHSGVGRVNLKFKLYVHPHNPDVVVFVMVYPYSNCLVKSSRMVRADSKLDRTQRGKFLLGTMTTEVSLDGAAATYKWPVGSFYLFVFLMLKWRGMNHGVIENWEDYMLRTYYHVFSTHSLAAHIEKHKLDSYYLLLGAQQTGPVVP